MSKLERRIREVEIEKDRMKMEKRKYCDYYFLEDFDCYGCESSGGCEIYHISEELEQLYDKAIDQSEQMGDPEKYFYYIKKGMNFTFNSDVGVEAKKLIAMGGEEFAIKLIKEYRRNYNSSLQLAGAYLLLGDKVNAIIEGIRVMYEGSDLESHYDVWDHPAGNYVLSIANELSEEELKESLGKTYSSLEFIRRRRQETATSAKEKILELEKKMDQLEEECVGKRLGDITEQTSKYSDYKSSHEIENKKIEQYKLDFE